MAIALVELLDVSVDVVVMAMVLVVVVLLGFVHGHHGGAYDSEKNASTYSATTRTSTIIQKMQARMRPLRGHLR